MKRIIVFLSVSLWAAVPGARCEAVGELTGKIAPRESRTLDAMDLQTGVKIQATAKGPPQLSIDIYVYSEASRELVAKSDDEGVEVFTWSPPVAGRYYIVLRNGSDVAGEYQIQLSKSESRSVTIGGPKNYADINIFYATDRAPVVTSSRKNRAYSGEPAETLEFGICHVSIPRSHRMGELEGPAIWRLEFAEDENKHIILQSTEVEEAASFFGDMSTRLNQSSKREALVFVHGFNVTFAEAARRAGQIAYDLAFPGATILYSWPSQGRAALIAYNKDGRNADLSVPHFNEFLSELTSGTGVRRIYVVAHSMGNRVVVRALARPGLPSRPKMQQVALLAPDVDSEEFRRLAEALKSSANHVTLYASSRDDALKASATFAGYPRAGESNAAGILVVPGIDTVDASAVDTGILGLWHSYYADNQTILSDLFYLIRDNLPDERSRLRKVQSSSGSYWSFVPSAR